MELSSFVYNDRRIVVFRMAVVQLSLDHICRGCLSRDNLQPLSKSQRMEVLAECIDLKVSHFLILILT